MVHINKNNISLVKYEPGIWYTPFYIPSTSKTYKYGQGAWGQGKYGSTETATYPKYGSNVTLTAVWFDDEYLSSVNLLSEIGPGKFYYDVSTYLLYIYKDDNSTSNLKTQPSIELSDYKKVKTTWINDSGVWKPIKKYVKVSGVWKEI